MKLLLAAVMVIALSGCGMFGRSMAVYTGSYEHCLGGVAYIQFASGVTVKYLANGQIATCEE